MIKIYRPSMSEAMRAKCCECMCNFQDGRKDCKVISCPLYQYNRYKKKPPKLNWIFGRWSSVHRTRVVELNISKPEYIKRYLLNSKGKINRSSCIRGKCFSCMGDFHSGEGEGRRDCMVTTCPIYYWAPYRKLVPDLNWMFDLRYTKRHSEAIIFGGISREEYIGMKLTMIEREE